MHVQTNHQQELTFDTLHAKPQSRANVAVGFMEPDVEAPRFTRSVVEEAGLGRFVYLKGASGKRYVFSAIEPQQAFLYESAVFAMTGITGECVSFSKSSRDQQARGLELGGAVYVHLLSDDEGSEDDVISDLSGSTH